MIFKKSGSFTVGFTVGFGAGILARDVFPYLMKIARPLTKEGLKLGIRSLEKVRENMAHFGETLSDITEEVKVELKQATTRSPAPHSTRSKAKFTDKKSRKEKVDKESGNSPIVQLTPRRTG